MKTNDTTGDDTALALQAVERWLEVHDAIVRGLAHSMSNRVATISAGLFMLGEGRSHDGAIPAASIAALHAEVDRLEQLLVQLRTLPTETSATEPLLATDSARAAIALHEHHAELRTVSCMVDDPGGVPPVRAVPQALLHALLVAITAAREAATPEDTVVLRLRGEDDVVHFIATVAATDDALTLDDDRFAREARAAARLLVSSAGRARAHAHGIVVTVPTLASTRRARS